MKKLVVILWTVTALIIIPLAVNAQNNEDNQDTCTECGGTGKIIVGEWDGDYYVESEITCPVCDGAGYIEKEPSAPENPQSE